MTERLLLTRCVKHLSPIAIAMALQALRIGCRNAPTLRSTIGRAKEVTNLKRDLVGCGVATRVQAWNNPKKEENAQVSVLESRLVINLSLYDNAHRNRSKHYLFFACSGTGWPSHLLPFVMNVEAGGRRASGHDEAQSRSAGRASKIRKHAW